MGQLRKRGDAIAIAPAAFDQKFDGDFLTTEQVRKRFGLKSINAVYRLVREYDLPRVRLGGRYRFRPSEIQAWLQQQRDSGGQPARLVVKGG